MKMEIMHSSTLILTLANGEVLEIHDSTNDSSPFTDVTITMPKKDKQNHEFSDKFHIIYGSISEKKGELDVERIRIFNKV